MVVTKRVQFDLNREKQPIQTDICKNGVLVRKSRTNRAQNCNPVKLKTGGADTENVDLHSNS